MKHAFYALVWEQVRKNRMVFPFLLLLLTAGAGLVHLVTVGDPQAWWQRLARQVLLTSFAASVLLSFAPFTLMESHSGWRMNSMVTRWFVLPVRTSLLVLIPFVAACGVVGLCLGGWLTLLRRLAPELDVTHVLLTLLLGVAVMQTLAWVLPRRPSQFWPALALWVPIVLFLALIPLEGAAWAPCRRALRVGVPVAVPVLAVIAYVSARRIRCGTWPGEIPLERLRRGVFRGGLAVPRVHSPTGALFWSDVAPPLRTFLASWLAFLGLILGFHLLMMLTHTRRPLALGMLLQLLAVLTPPMAVFWLAVGGLFLGGEPGASFRTALSPFRAVRPVRTGTLAGQRLALAAGCWLLVWLPWMAVVWLFRNVYPELAMVDLPQIWNSAGRLMALSAHALVGALPILLWGRLDGFANLLLAAIVSWAGTWGLANYFAPSPEDTMPWPHLRLLLGVKFGLGVGALLWSWRRGQIGWRYVSGLIGAWTLCGGCLAFALPTWQTCGAWGVATVALFLPFARLALAPAALAANRHR